MSTKYTGQSVGQAQRVGIGGGSYGEATRDVLGLGLGGVGWMRGWDSSTRRIVALGGCGGSYESCWDRVGDR